MGHIQKQTKIIYKTADGREFSTEASARKHDVFLETRGLLQGLVPNNKLDVISFSDLATVLLNQRKNFSKSFGTLSQRFTQVEKSASLG